MRSGRTSRAIPVISASTASKSASRDRRWPSHGPPQVPVRCMQQRASAGPSHAQEQSRPPPAGLPDTIHQELWGCLENSGTSGRVGCHAGTTRRAGEPDRGAAPRHPRRPGRPATQDRVRELRAELRRAERSWDALVTPPDRPEEDRQGLASLLPAREQVHQALTLLGVPGRAQADRRGARRLLRRAARRVPAGQPAPGRGALLPGRAGRQALLPVPGADIGPAVPCPRRCCA